jgi:hypothetical protein
MQNVVRNNRPASGGFYWLGGTCGSNCAAAAGIWVWESGEPWSYTYWAGGEPNFSNHNEGCLYMYPDGSWNDINCFYAYSYICQVLPTIYECPIGMYV